MSFWSRIERRLTDLAGDLLPDDVRDQLDLARTQLSDGDPNSAAEILSAVIDARPDHVGALSLLGVAELERNDPAAALRAFEGALTHRNDLADAQIGRGQALLGLERLSEATAAFRAAVEAAGGDRELLAIAYRGSGLAYRRLGELDKAVRELRKAVAESPRDPLALAALGEALHVHPEISDAEATKYLSWAREGEAPALAYLVSGQIALAEGRTIEAGELFATAGQRAEAAAQPSERAAALIGSADVFASDGLLVDAHQTLLRALEIAPHSVDVHSRLADIHNRGGNRDAALTAYDRARELGANGRVLAAATVVAIEAGDALRVRAFSDALAKAAMTAPERTLAEVAAGVFAALEGNREAAVEIFERVLATRDSPEAQLGLAEVLLEENPARAAEHALLALRGDSARTRNRARDLVTKARRAELGIEAEAAQTPDLVAAFSGLERLCLARPELSPLARSVAEAASDFDRPLLVTVMGEFSSGKSTFVNAFIGAEVAPTGITPTTATINVVRHGRERAGRILYRDDRSEDVPWEALFARLRGLAPEEVANISRVEILLPLDILERVNLVDTPGLNSILPEHEAVAREFIARADAVVWVFSAGQAGKKTEGSALGAIRQQGVRVLGALNKIDQLSEADVEQVLAMVDSELGEHLEAIVPVSARKAAAGEEGSRWGDLEAALEEHFFARAHKLKASAARRKQKDIIERARREISGRRDALISAATAIDAALVDLRGQAVGFETVVGAAERRAIASELGNLYRDAAREVLDLVLPRRLPFGSHKAAAADRDYLISLLDTRLEGALSRSRVRAFAAIREAAAGAIRVEHEISAVLGEAAGSMQRAIEAAADLFEARVYSSALAFLRGYLRGGFVEHFFRIDLPKIDLAEDAIYHALYRDSPNIDAIVGKQIGVAGQAALSGIADHLELLGRVVSARQADLEEGTIAALDALEARAGS